MKTLLVLRHAKSSWDDASLSDFERPLNGRGKRAAPFMGEVIKDRALEPDLILSSPAVRARETARLLAESSGYAGKIQHDTRMYEASPTTLQQVVAEVDNRFEAVMVVGHNPGMEGLVRTLTGKSERMPTAALAVIDLDISDWSDLRHDSGKLRDLMRPKDLQKKSKK
jgi:phosphohistidine phosphatase